MAEQKVTMELSHKREIKKLRDRLDEEKHARERENKAWVEQHDQALAAHKA